MKIEIESLVGKTVTLKDRCRRNDVREIEPGIIRTGWTASPTRFVIEKSPVANSAARNDANVSNRNMRYIAFRVEGTSRYLTLNPYGNARAHILESLSSSEMPMLLPDLYENIIDYIVGDETGANNFEGRGFNYDPMKAEESHTSSPTILQSFCIEGDSLHEIGVKSVFGKYWRSQHWENTISQSPHMLLDETWSVSVLEHVDEPDRTRANKQSLSRRLRDTMNRRF